MSFDPESLLTSRFFLQAIPSQREMDDPANEIVVSGISPHVELIGFHKFLSAVFKENVLGLCVDVREAKFTKEQPFQECKVLLSKPVDATLVETCIHRALDITYNRKGLMFERRDIHIVPTFF